ncbi:MAG TPA: hypothetical protein VM866_04240 [Pyrinomonadaceae bacterium]|nr:hypothetical protein [Pyrinomonadaceae bacterium]
MSPLLMRLAAKSHKNLEVFLREHLGDESLRLPSLTVYCGRFAGLITRLVGVGAITLGRFILVSPRLIARDGRGRLIVPGWLMAHEAMHVVQYGRAGVIRFLIEYFGGYWRTLLEGKKLNAAARMYAYLSIAEECDARVAEAAYRTWIQRKAGRAVDENEVAETRRDETPAAT